MGADYKPKQTEAIMGNTNTGIPANTTQYFSTDGGGGGEISRGYIINRIGMLTELRVRTQNAPGVGETYDYTIWLNGAPTALTVQIAGAAQFVADVGGAVAVIPGDRLTLELATSLNAANSNHSWSFLHQH